MFRGFILRTLREADRPEFWVMIISSVWFGALHFPNLFLGSSALAVLLQILLSSLTGMTLCMFRRSSGFLVTGMAAHGLWDISVFLPVPKEAGFHLILEGTSLALTTVAALISGTAVYLHHRKSTKEAG